MNPSAMLVAAAPGLVTRLPTLVLHTAGRTPPTNQVSDPKCAGQTPPTNQLSGAGCPLYRRRHSGCRHSAPRASRRQSVVAWSRRRIFACELFVLLSLALNRVRPTTAGLLIDQPPRDPPINKTQPASRSSRRRGRPRARAPRCKSNAHGHAWVCGRSAPNQPIFGPPCAA